jgi:hypothetical protein
MVRIYLFRIQIQFVINVNTYITSHEKNNYNFNNPDAGHTMWLGAKTRYS